MIRHTVSRSPSTHLSAPNLLFLVEDIDTEAGTRMPPSEQVGSPEGWGWENSWSSYRWKGLHTWGAPGEIQSWWKLIQESTMTGQQRKKKGSIKEHRGTIRDTQVANKGSAFHICHRPWQNSDVFESHVVSCLSFNLKPFDTAREKTLKEHKKPFNVTIPNVYFNLSICWQILCP